MDLQNRRIELTTAWRALYVSTDAIGWRTISVRGVGGIEVRAGCRFPGNEEAILLNFKSISYDLLEQLPHAYGFAVSIEQLPVAGVSSPWVALSIESFGNLDFFSMMAEDVLNSIDSLDKHSDQKVFQLFINRILGWQDFMKKNRNGLLSREEEIGLFGELTILSNLIKEKSSSIINCWRGPFGNLQDFIFKNTSIEVKSTTSEKGFFAQISSLGQLEATKDNQIYLACLNFTEDSNGETLPEKIQKITEQINHDVEAVFVFENCLLHAGYSTDMQKKYVRQMRCNKLRIYKIDNEFPKLTFTSVPLGITKAQYEINIDSINSHVYEFENFINEWEY